MGADPPESMATGSCSFSEAAWVFATAWASSRLALLAIYVGFGWLVSNASDETTLDSSVGAGLGLGQFLVVPAALVLSGIVWSMGAVCSVLSARVPRIAIAGVGASVLAEFVGTTAFFLTLLPAHWPVVFASSCFGGGSSWLLGKVSASVRSRR